MRIILSLFLIMFCCEISFCQNKVLSVPYPTCDTCTWLKSFKKDTKNKGLVDLLSSKDKLHIRLRSNAKAVDIWTNDNKIFYGTVTYYFTKYNYRKSKETNKTFYSIQKIDTSKAKTIYNWIQDFSILKLPSGDSIPHSCYSSHPSDIILENSTNSFYSYKYYKDPLECYQLSSIKFLDTVNIRIDWLLDLDNNYKKHFKSLPRGYYYNGGTVILHKSSLRRKKFRT